MKYAVVTAGGKQYKVAEGDVITIDRLPEEAQATYIFPEVLLYVDGDTQNIGTPLLTDVIVTGKVLDHIKGEKIRVSKFKAKAKYRRVTGFRAFLTKVQIASIATKGEKKETKKDEKKAEKPASDER